jgi:hypothetical protein
MAENLLIDALPGHLDLTSVRFAKDLAWNSLRQVVFAADYAARDLDEKLTERGTAIFATDPAGKLHLLAATHAKVKIGDSDEQKVKSLMFVGNSGGNDGHGTCLSKQGIVVFSVCFEGNESALISADFVSE